MVIEIHLREVVKLAGRVARCYVRTSLLISEGDTGILYALGYEGPIFVHLKKLLTQGVHFLMSERSARCKLTRVIRISSRGVRH